MATLQRAGALREAAGAPRSNCFVCGDGNPRGLRLRFAIEGAGRVLAEWRPARDFEGFPGIIHGGIVSAVLDEAMSKAVAASGSRALTCDLRVRLRRSVEAGAALTVRGWVVEKRKRRVAAEAAICDAGGGELAHAWAAFLEARNGEPPAGS